MAHGLDGDYSLGGVGKARHYWHPFRASQVDAGLHRQWRQRVGGGPCGPCHMPVLGRVRRKPPKSAQPQEVHGDGDLEQKRQSIERGLEVRRGDNPQRTLRLLSRYLGSSGW